MDIEDFECEKSISATQFFPCILVYVNDQQAQATYQFFSGVSDLCVFNHSMPFSSWKKSIQT